MNGNKYCDSATFLFFFIFVFVFRLYLTWKQWWLHFPFACSLWWVGGPSKARPAQRCQPLRSFGCGQQWVRFSAPSSAQTAQIIQHNRETVKCGYTSLFWWCLLNFSFFFVRSMYVFGGFSGVLLNDVLVYRPLSCQAFSAEEGCLKAGPGVSCVWSRGRCVPWEPSSLEPLPFCPPKPGKTIIHNLLHMFLIIVGIHAFSVPLSLSGWVVLQVLRLQQLHGEHRRLPVVRW